MMSILKNKNLNFLTNKPLLHRGFFDNITIPENSLEAIKKSIKMGYGVEVDIHVTSDKKIVVFHDYNLNRMCGINKRVEDLTYDEISKYSLLNTNYKVSSLIDILKEVRGQVPVLIEVKGKKIDTNFLKILSSILDNYNGEFAIQSFNIKIIKWFLRNKSNYNIGLLINNMKKTSLLKKIHLLFIKNKVDFISSNIKNNLKSKKTILGWTIVDKNQYKSLHNKFDGFIVEKEVL